MGKCEIDNTECHINMVQTVLRDIAKTGIEELGIPAIDPMILKNVSVNVLDIIDITMIDGTAKGVKDCVINKAM